MSDATVIALLAAALAFVAGIAVGATAATSRLGGRFRDLSAEALERGGASLVSPVRDALERMEEHLRDLERARSSAYGALVEQVGAMRTTSEQLRTETAALVSALRAPQSRGRWGEMQLRRVVEVAGMVEHCDFDEQPTVAGGQRPDMVVRLAGGRALVVDAKVPLSAYLEGVDAAYDDERAARFAAHAKALRAHVDALAGRAYWHAVEGSPELVVLFVPGEAFLAPALEHDPALLEYAMSRRVVVASPTTLVAMLRAVGYAWQQSSLADNARQVFDVAAELHRRLATFAGHVDHLGKALGRAVGDYNAAVGSLESRVLPQVRRLREMRVVEHELPVPHVVDTTPRRVTAPETDDVVTVTG